TDRGLCSKSASFVSFLGTALLRKTFAWTTTAFWRAFHTFRKQHRPTVRGEYNVTLEGYGLMAKIPCFLCSQEIRQRKDKNQKPYFICDPCGVQIFIRGRQ